MTLSLLSVNCPAPWVSRTAQLYSAILDPCQRPPGDVTVLSHFEKDKTKTQTKYSQMNTNSEPAFRQTQIPYLSTGRVLSSQAADYIIYPTKTIQRKHYLQIF